MYIIKNVIEYRDVSPSYFSINFFLKISAIVLMHIQRHHQAALPRVDKELIQIRPELVNLSVFDVCVNIIIFKKNL